MINKYTAIVSFLTNIPEHTRGCDEVLAFVYNNDRQGVLTRITDVVNTHRFGTGPTVHSKIRSLECQKLIKLTKCAYDARAKVIELTDKGTAYLRGQDKQIGQMLGAMV